MLAYRFLLCAVLALASVSCRADTLKSEAELRPLAEAVMAKAAANDIDAAFRLMGPFTIVSAAEYRFAALQMAAQREQALARYGKAIGYELVGQRKFGESWMVLVFFEITANHALPWTFHFFRSPNGWVINSFQWSDKPQSIFGIIQ